MEAQDNPSPPAEDSLPETEVKKPRRQVAFYPNMNTANKPLKPFSRSAAKRESVMALGSIEHLQHYFTKTGIAAETNPLSNKSNSHLVPAIGGRDTKAMKIQTLGGTIRDFELPPSPVVPEMPRQPFSPYVKTYETDPENIRPTVIEDLSSVEQAWWLDHEPQPDLLSAENARGKGHDPDHVDVLDILRITTHAVRSVRNYLLSLPDDTATPVNPQFRSSVTPSRSPVPRRMASQPDLATDPLTRIRRSALEVLGVLRGLEEFARLPLSDDAYDAQSDHGEHASVSGGSGSGSGGSHSRATSPSMSDLDPTISISYVQVGGRNISVPVWEDDEDIDLNQMSEEQKRDRWEERLVLGTGWLYRQDIRQADLVHEREVIAKYLNAVDDVLFKGMKEGKRGWERERFKMEKDRRGKGRRVSAGDAEFAPAKRSNRRVVSTSMLDAMKALVVTEEPDEMDSISEAESLDDDELPEWAKRTSFLEDPIGRLHALLQALLPASLGSLLPPGPAERASLLQALSSGQLLCVAYNTGVRRSRKPWGYVSRDAIHDIASLEAESADRSDQENENAKRGWTFRRTDNLRLWAAALKLRYEIPVISPPSAQGGGLSPGDGTTPLSSPTPTSMKFPRTDEPPIHFDATLVARREEGWEFMLEHLVLRWMTSIIDERRGFEKS